MAHSRALTGWTGLNGVPERDVGELATQRARDCFIFDMIPESFCFAGIRVACRDHNPTGVAPGLVFPGHRATAELRKDKYNCTIPPA